MRIDLLKTSPDRAGRYYVRFDNGSEMKLYRQTVEDFGLYSSMELSEECYHKLEAAAGQMSAKMRAVRIISAANVSKKDLEKRLIQKGEQAGQAKEAISWLEDLHLLDDRKTAEQIVHSCISKGYGISRAKQVLYEKRIPKDLWDEVLSDYPDQIDRITDYLRTKITDKADERAVKKAIDSLLRRGHSYSAIREALRDLVIESDEFQEDEVYG